MEIECFCNFLQLTTINYCFIQPLIMILKKNRICFFMKNNWYESQKLSQYFLCIHKLSYKGIFLSLYTNVNLLRFLQKNLL